MIAVGIAKTGYLYVGISPRLWDDLGRNFADSWAVVKALQADEYFKNCRMWTSAAVNETLLNGIKFNKGCAEKRVVSAAHCDWNDTITQISITEHPVDANPGQLAAHIGVGTGTATYYAPCRSCIEVAKLVFKQ
jgi:hypothetical protein